MSAIAVHDKAQPGGRVAKLVQEAADRGRRAWRMVRARSAALARQLPRY